MTEQEPIRLDLSELGEEWDGAWVEVKPRRSYGDRLAVRRAATVAGERAGQLRYDATRGELAALDRAIVGWSFAPEIPSCQCDQVEVGAVAACPRWAVLEDLDGDVGDWLQLKLMETYAGQVRTPQAKRGAVAQPARRKS